MDGLFIKILRGIIGFFIGVLILPTSFFLLLIRLLWGLMDATFVIKSREVNMNK